MSATHLTALIARCRALSRPRLQEQDAELLRRFMQGRDAAAFEELLERYAPLVWGVCRRTLASEADCEDVFQATFLALIRKPDAIDPQQPLGGWLHTVAVRIARKTAAHARRERPKAAVSEPATCGDIADGVGNRELFRLVDDVIERLPARLRQPLVLCCLEGRTRDEAAEALGCSVTAVKSRLQRGRDLLRRRLQRRGVQLPAAFLVLGLTGERIRAALWAKTMQTALYTPSPELVALANVGANALTAGKYKLLLAMILLATTAAGAVGSLLMTETSQPSPAATAKDAGEPTKLPSPLVRTDQHGDPLPEGAIARLGTVRWRHGFFISALAFSPDSKKIAAIGAGRDITLWDAATGKEIRSFPNEGKQPIRVAFSPDGTLLTTADRRGIVSLWDVDRGKIVRQVKCQKMSLSDAAFSPDGKTLAVGDSGGTIYFWDPYSGAEQRRIETEQGILHTLAFSPDGNLLASGGSRGTGDYDGSLLLWNARTGREERRFKVHTREIWRVVFSPDGKLLASAGWDDGVCLWEPLTGRRVRVLTEKSSFRDTIAFAPDSTMLAVGHTDGTVRLWSTADGTEKRSWETGSQRIFTLAFSPDGKTIASAAGAESDIRLWDVATGREKHPSDEHRGSINLLRFSPDGKALTSIGYDRRILRWDLATNTPRQLYHWTSQNSDTFALSPDGKTLAVGDRYRPNSGVRLWDIRTAKQVCVLDNHEEGAWCLAFSPDGRLLACGYREGLIPKKGVIHIWDISNGKKIRQITGFETEVEWLCFAPDSKALACGMTTRGKPTNEPTLRLWDVASGKERCSFDCRVFTEARLAFSPDRKILASGHGYPGDPPRQASMVRLWDTATGKELLRYTGPGDEIDSLAFSPDGKLIASGSSGRSLTENTVHVWEAVTGQLIRHFEGHHSGVGSLVFSPDGLTVASGAGDSTILLWDITGRRSNGRWHVKPLSLDELNSCWQNLANPDAAKAYDAVWRLVAAPERAVPFLRKTLPPAPRPDTKAVARWIAELDSDDFTVRQKANDELSKFGDAIAPSLREALQGKPSLETRRRLQQLLDQTHDWTPERLRVHRAIQALEHIGTSSARKTLQRLAEGAPGVFCTEEGKAALQRMARSSGT